MTAANDDAAVRIEAQAKAGEILTLMPKNEGMRLGGRDSFGGPVPVPPREQVPRLSDVGITKIQSSRWQHVASIPEPVRREYVETVKDEGGAVTTAGLVRFDLERRAAS